MRTLLHLPLAVRLAICALAALLWVFWPTLCELASRWGNSSQYSHGWLVPLFAVYLLWSRRSMLPSQPAQPWAWGLVILMGGLGLHFLGTFVYFDWLTAMSLLPCLAGLCLLAGGWKVLHWAWPAIGFLIFMVPLPFRLETGLAQPLQRIATAASTYALQTLGIAAYSEGTVIRMGEIRIGVVEACSGLSMLLIFFALSTGVVLLAKCSVLEKGVIFLSAVPIALVSNITRIVVTAILHRTVGSEWADYVFHDLAGWLMPILALALLWVEWQVLGWVLVTPPAKQQAFIVVPGLERGRKQPAGGRAPQAAGTAKKSIGPGILP